MEESSEPGTSTIRASPSVEGSFWRSPISVAIWAMLSFAILFEPVRTYLLHSQTAINVGGVGGVGGLVNLGGCDNNQTSCSNFQWKYSYEKGSVGPFTPFAFITLFFWVGPLILACGVIWLNKGASYASLSAGSLLGPVWVCLNLVWFTLPAVQFGAGLREFSGIWERSILTVGLAAAHALSWNLSLVVIPTGGVLSKLVRVDKSSSKEHWFFFHRLLGYTTAFWGLVHGVAEFLYFCTTQERFWSLWALHSNGEVLLYWAGLASFLLLSAQVLGAYLRRRWSSSKTFAEYHRRVAAALLLLAAAHWWPFCLFFLPATSIHGMALVSAVDAWSVRQTAVGLGSALLAGVLGLWPVWSLRDAYMASSDANLYVPFVFPPLGVVASTVAASVSTRLLQRVMVVPDLDKPLLPLDE